MATVVPPGGTATTDTEGDGATTEDPIETSVTSPGGGAVSISESATTGTPPTGFGFLGQQVSITAPPATATDPLVLVFRIDSSLIPAGENQNTIQILKNGVLVPACSGAPGDASPIPSCVSNRALVGDDVEITVLSSEASFWTPVISLGPTCNGLPATRVGTARSDIIFGTRHRDVIVALGGNDLIFGRSGDDVICAGNGNDIAFGQNGDDWMDGGAGNDILDGGDDDDHLDGGPQRDVCHGGDGHNTFVNCEFRLPRHNHHDDEHDD